MKRVNVLCVSSRIVPEQQPAPSHMSASMSMTLVVAQWTLTWLFQPRRVISVCYTHPHVHTLLVHSCACKPCHIQTFEAVIYRASVRIEIIFRCFPETHSLATKPATVAGRTFLQDQAGFYLLHCQKKKGHQQEFGLQRVRALEPSAVHPGF